MGPGPSAPRAIFDCVGTLANGGDQASVTCAPATLNGPAAADPVARAVIERDVIVGRQNVDVTLAFSNFSFNRATGVFATSVTVKNLLNQPMGEVANASSSPNGTRVFFVNSPAVAVTKGTGTARDSNPDGFATFTSGLQPFYKYPAVIPPNGTSPSKQWIFVLSSAVTGFTFSLEVDAPLPAEKSVRRWVSLRQGLTGNPLTGTWQHTSSDIYAVGLGGALLQYNGTTWSTVGGLPASNYRSVSGVAGQAAASVWAVGDNGVAVHDTAGTWSTSSTGSSANLFGVWVAGPGNVYAVGSNATILHFTGVAWVPMVVPGGVNATLRAVWGADATHIWAVGDNGTVLFGNGVTWVTQTSRTSQSLRGVWGDAATDVFAVGTSGTIDHLSGGTWATQTSTSSNDLTAVGGTSATDIWAVGNAGTTLHYNGAWSTVGPHMGIPLAAVTSGSATPWAVGAEGSLVSYTGSVWQVSMQSGLAFNGVWAASPTDVWVATLGTVLHYNGTQWTNAYVSPADSMTSIWGTAGSPDSVITVGVNGNVAVYAGSWTLSNYPVNIYSVWELGSNDVFAGLGFGLIGHYDGRTAFAFFQPTTQTFYGVWGSSATNVVAAGGGGTIYSYPGSGKNWTRITSSTTQNLYSVGGSSGSDMYAVGANGTVVHGTGNTPWTTQTSGTTSTLRGMWAAVPQAPYTADAYAVGDNGVVQHSNGSQWLSMPTPVTTTLRSVCGTSATNLYVVGDNGVVLLGTQ